MSLSRLSLLALVGAVLLAAACGGDDGDDAAPTTGTAQPGATSVAVPTPTPRWPEVARATITTEDLNVRTGPGGTYPVIGRLQPDDDVPVSGRLTGGDWLALPGIGWIAYAEEWMRLSIDFGTLPQIAQPQSAFEFTGPVHPADGRSGIPIVDQVLEAIASRDRDLLLRLANAPAPASTGTAPSATAPATPFPTLVPEVTEPPTSATATALPPQDCSNDPIPGARLRDYLTALYRTQVPAAVRGGDGAGVLRMYGVVRGPVPQNGTADYVIVFAFEQGEGRQVWVSPDGRITQFTLPCEPTLPGSLLRVTMGEPFFWFRPPVRPPVRPLP